MSCGKCTTCTCETPVAEKPAVKERPILFSTPMVNAILSGQKTQTRRVNGLKDINSDPDRWKILRKLQKTESLANGGITSFPGADENSWIALQDPKGIRDFEFIVFSCPYGKFGDVLWVRETWAYSNGIEPYGAPFIYKADLEGGNMTSRSYQFSFDEDQLDNLKFKPSIHMPREACRLRLEITNIRVERLQDISEDDAKAEGVSPNLTSIMVSDPLAFPVAHYIEFHKLWESINGAESWNSNPWVWVIEFKVLKGGAK